MAGGGGDSSSARGSRDNPSCHRNPGAAMRHAYAGSATRVRPALLQLCQMSRGQDRHWFSIGIMTDNTANMKELRVGHERCKHPHTPICRLASWYLGTG